MWINAEFAYNLHPKIKIKIYYQNEDVENQFHLRANTWSLRLREYEFSSHEIFRPVWSLRISLDKYEITQRL